MRCNSLWAGKDGVLSVLRTWIKCRDWGAWEEGCPQFLLLGFVRSQGLPSTAKLIPTCLDRRIAR